MSYGGTGHLRVDVKGESKIRLVLPTIPERTAPYLQLRTVALDKVA